MKLCRRRTITSYHEKYKGYTVALAVQNGHVECVRVLLDLGADPFLRDINKMPNPHLVDPTCPYWLTRHKATFADGSDRK